MERDYDTAVADHYRQVAETEGMSWSSTMADEIVRQTETDAIVAFVGDIADSGGAGLRIADVGCGNGYTLGMLAPAFPDCRFTGFEMIGHMRGLAEERVAERKLANVTIRPGDIREPDFTGGETFDVLVCQRVLINLLDGEDQARALDNLLAVVEPGGGLIFVEAFRSGLNTLNEARDEFDLPAIPPAHHNIYLSDDFFARDALVAYESEGWTLPPNVLSTHYYVSRVLYPLLLDGRPLIRNAHFIKVLSRALPPAIGNYSQVRIHAFRKAREGR